MTNENVNSSEGFLGNIAEELGTLSGTCNEIKEAQLNCATTDDLAKFKDELDNNLVLYTHAIRTSTENCEGAVNQSTDQICDSITEFKDDFDQKFDDFRANPPVQKVEKTIRIARESWQWYLTLGFTVFSTLLFFAMTFWQEGRIEQCRISDIKYHYILMHNGINPVGLDSIESWFHDPDKVRIIESEVRDYEERVQETARALDQKHRLEEKINELNSQTQNSKK
ncbi:hypothetical protein [uncultured Duncaniella sp.]|uniref:hypothetical protein n=2 Tax=Muribaculaceae TaxID=2005473 RepID=UPI0026206276|nr:hypothetical protein [uncultured Duncaniella sp.]